MMKFMKFINFEFKLKIHSYSSLYDWSIKNIDLFWESFRNFSKIKFSKHPQNIIDDINELINKFKLKRVGLTDMLTWDDKVKQSKYIIQKIEEVEGVAITDQDWEEFKIEWDYKEESK